MAFARGVGMNNQHIIAPRGESVRHAESRLDQLRLLCHPGGGVQRDGHRQVRQQDLGHGRRSRPVFASALHRRVGLAEADHQRPRADRLRLRSPKRSTPSRFTSSSTRASPRRPATVDLWLPLRPGTDAAMALGWMNLIIEEELFDRSFVERHCHGFEELRARAKEYPLARVADITWCDPELIARAARLYATTKPGSIVWGNGLEHAGRNSFQSIRAVLILMGICGNIDVPGGNVFYPAPPLAYPDLRDKLGAAQEAKRLGGQKFKALNKAGFAHAPTLFRTILSDEPYPVKGFDRGRQQRGHHLSQHRARDRGAEEGRAAGGARHLHDPDRRVRRRRASRRGQPRARRAALAPAHQGPAGDVHGHGLAQGRRAGRAQVGLGVHDRAGTQARLRGILSVAAESGRRVPEADGHHLGRAEGAATT